MQKVTKIMEENQLSSLEESEPDSQDLLEEDEEEINLSELSCMQIKVKNIFMSHSNITAQKVIFASVKLNKTAMKMK